VPPRLRGESDSKIPLVLLRSTAHRQTVVAVCNVGRDLGIKPGHALAQARAICSHLHTDEYAPHLDSASLLAMARWLMRYTPIVSLVDSHTDPESVPPFASSKKISFAGTRFGRSRHHHRNSAPAASDFQHALYLDLTGTTRLLGPAEMIAHDLRCRFATLHIDCRIALGATPAAAWAMTFTHNTESFTTETRKHGEGKSDLQSAFVKAKPSTSDLRLKEKSNIASTKSKIQSPLSVSPCLRGEFNTQSQIANRKSQIPSPSVSPCLRGDVDSRLRGEFDSRLDSAPVHALRLSHDTVATLHHLGLTTVGQLRAMPADQLPARFGPDILLRLAQLDGRVDEPLNPVAPLAPILVSREWDFSVETLEPLWPVIDQLLGRLLRELTRRCHGLRSLDLTLHRGKLHPIRRSIHLSAPTRDQPAILKLIRTRLEQACLTLAADSQTSELHSPTSVYNVTTGAYDLTTGVLSSAEHEHSTHQHPRSSRHPSRRKPPRLPRHEGFTGLRLFVARSEPLIDHQQSFLESPPTTADLAHLLDTLRTRLAHDQITFITPVESHLPEKAWAQTSEPSNHRTPSPISPRRHGDTEKSNGINTSPDQLDQSQIGNRKSEMDSSLSAPPCLRGEFEPQLAIGNRKSEMDSPFSVSPCLRGEHLAPTLPTLLYPAPIEVRVTVAPSHDLDGRPVQMIFNDQLLTLTHAVGPHRISGLWWQHHHKTRDYFDVHDTAGQRLWIFRVTSTSRWFLHGLFA
jgi:nucleotidyltransferase/DNA polymerase involved in DNA repair